MLDEFPESPMTTAERTQRKRKAPQAPVLALAPRPEPRTSSADVFIRVSVGIIYLWFGASAST